MERELLLPNEIDELGQLAERENSDSLRKLISIYNLVTESPEEKVNLILNKSLDKIMDLTFNNNLFLDGEVTEKTDAKLKASILVAEKMGVVLKNIKEVKVAVGNSSDKPTKGKYVPQVGG